MGVSDLVYAVKGIIQFSITADVRCSLSSKFFDHLLCLIPFCFFCQTCKNLYHVFAVFVFYLNTLFTSFTAF